MKRTLIVMLATAALSLPALAQQQNDQSNNAGAQQQQTQNQPKQNQQSQNQSKQNQKSQNEQSATAPMRVSKSAVRNIQQKLDKKGYRSGREDGIIGPETTTALRNFQRKRGLRVTGQVDQQTLKALGMSTTTRNRPGYASSNKGTSAQGASGQGQANSQGQANKGH